MTWDSGGKGLEILVRIRVDNKYNTALPQWGVRNGGPLRFAMNWGTIEGVGINESGS